ncbi:MAG: hypothetical protein ACAH83_07255 [Alphaproteobacteria bacterium]
MAKNYSEHPSYGKEDHNHKVVTLTFGAALTDRQWDAMGDDEPQLDSKFDALSYCDGDRSGKSLSHDWENTDTNPRGLIGYVLSRNELKIWASEAVTPEYFMVAARYVIAEAGKTPGLGEAEVVKVSTNGIAVGYSGDTLGEVGASMDIARRSPRPTKANQPKPGGR